MLEFLFVSDAEPLLFVNDNKTEFRQFHVVRQNAVRADNDIDIAFLGRLDNRLLLLRTAKTRKQIDLCGKRGETLSERFEMLIGENGRRR